MKIGKSIKITVAGTVTWVAAVRSYSAIVSGEWAWSHHYLGEEVDLLTILPPLVATLGFLLFRWAFGEAFVAWLINSKPTVGSILFFLLISAAVINASAAADMAEQTYSMADEANSAAQEAASEASSANSACSYR